MLGGGVSRENILVIMDQSESSWQLQAGLAISTCRMRPFIFFEIFILPLSGSQDCEIRLDSLSLTLVKRKKKKEEKESRK